MLRVRRGLEGDVVARNIERVLRRRQGAQVQLLSSRTMEGSEWSDSLSGIVCRSNRVRRLRSAGNLLLPIPRGT